MSAISSACGDAPPAARRCRPAARSSVLDAPWRGRWSGRRARRRCRPRRRRGCRCPAIGEPAPATASSACGRCSCSASKSLATRVRTMRMAAPASETRIWLIAGPTASGKSALALRLAQMVGGEIVNADSMQLYADLAVLTRAAAARGDAAGAAPPLSASPTPPTAGRSAAGWRRRARCWPTSRAGGAPAIVVGGTGLYFRALTQGLAGRSERAARRDRRADRRVRADRASWRSAPRLARLDPEAAARIARGDRQRLVRALAVAEAHRPPAQRLAGRHRAAAGAGRLARRRAGATARGALRAPATRGSRPCSRPARSRRCGR